MDMQFMMPCGISASACPEGTIIHASDAAFSDGPLLRVRDGLRDCDRLAPGVLRERGIILEIMLAGNCWQEIECKPYIRFLQDDEGKIGRMLMTPSAKKDAEGELVWRGIFHASSMIESAFYF